MRLSCSVLGIAAADAHCKASAAKSLLTVLSGLSQRTFTGADDTSDLGQNGVEQQL